MNPIIISPFFASGALRFAFEKATTEGKMTICALVILSVFSWTVIITKARQLYRARKAGKKFFSRLSRDPRPLGTRPARRGVRRRARRTNSTTPGQRKRNIT